MATILDRITQRPRTSGPNPALLEASGLWPWNWRRSPSGVRVTDDNALGLTAVYRAINLISTTAGGQPIHVFQENPDGTKERADVDDVAFLWDRPNPEMSNQTYWETVVGHEVMGDAFLFVVKDARGDPLELWYIEPWRVNVGRAESGTKVYLVDNETAMIDYAAGGEVIHVPNWGRDPLRGINPIKIGSAAIALGLSAQEYAERFFSQDSTPRGVLTSEQDLTMEQASALEAAWVRSGGLDNAHRTRVLGSGAKFQQISISPHDAQLIEERGLQGEEVARLFGIPPHMLGFTEKVTSWGSGIEELTRGFLTYTLQNHINRFEQAINYALLRRAETKRYVKFDLAGLLRPNALQQAQLHAMGYGRWLSTNDIRRALDLPPIDGGDDVLAAQNLIPLADLGAVQGPGAPADMPGGGGNP